MLLGVILGEQKPTSGAGSGLGSCLPGLDYGV